VHFRRTERHDRFVGGQKPPEKVTDTREGSVLQLRTALARRRTEEDRSSSAVVVGSGDPCVRSTCGDCRQCPLTADAGRRRSVGADLGSVANRSVTCPTRLETRTKESNMCASQWVLRNPEAQWKQSPALAVGPGRILVVVVDDDDRRGALPARLGRNVGEAERERTRWDPKDGELCPSRTKPEETLVEVRSDSDVQIDRQTWV